MGLSYQITHNKSNMNEKQTSFFFEQPKAVAQLVHEYTKSIIPVFQPMNWLQRRMMKWCFGFIYEKLNS